MRRAQLGHAPAVDTLYLKPQTDRVSGVRETRKPKIMWRINACRRPQGGHSLRAAVASGLLVFALAGALQGQQRNLLSESTKALYQNEFARSATLASQLLKTHPGDSKGLVVLARAQMAVQAG